MFDATLEISEFERRLSRDDFLNYLYCENDQVVGYISIKGGSHIYHLFVLKEFQGKGIAKALWNHVIKNVYKNSYTARSSIVAVPVYESFGFKVCGEPMRKDGISFQEMERVK